MKKIGYTHILILAFCNFVFHGLITGAYPYFKYYTVKALNNGHLSTAELVNYSEVSAIETYKYCK